MILRLAKWTEDPRTETLYMYIFIYSKYIYVKEEAGTEKVDAVVAWVD